MKKFKDITIVIDPGHGGKDPGGVGNGLKEKDLTLAIALLLGAILKAFGINIIYTRTTDVYVSLSTRAKIANDAKADLFISIHINASGGITANGVEIFSHPNSTKGMILSKDILNQILLDNLFKTNRGNKTANFAVLRLTNMPAVLTETGFIDHQGDAQILRTKQKEIAEAMSKGILKNLGMEYNGATEEIKGTNILSRPTGSIKQMQEWARTKKAHPKFIELAPLFYKISEKAGVDPIVTYTQSAKETGYMNFGGVLDISYNNPCGMKGSSGGGDYDPNAHMRFRNWEDGIMAQVDHLALYAGANDYPKTDTTDPRHFPYLKGTTTTVEGLSGKWAPSNDYGQSIVRMMKDLQGIKVVEEENDNDRLIEILLHGKDIEVEGIFLDKTNYVPIRFLEELGYAVSWKNGKVHINYRKD